MIDRRLTREWVHGLVALALGLFLLGASSNFSVLKNVVDVTGAILSIPEYPAVLLRDTASEFYGWAREKNDLRRQVAFLTDENAKLRIAASAVVAERIKSELDGRTDSVRVTLREPGSWWNELRIDKGLNDGMSIGLPVFQNGFLVGRISSVSSLSSWVELITSPSLMVPVVIEETRDLGIVVGDGNGGVILTYIPEGRGVERGMSISTALVNEKLPSGMPVGKVDDEIIKEGAGYATYKVIPGASLASLYSISVLNYPHGGQQ